MVGATVESQPAFNAALAGLCERLRVLRNEALALGGQRIIGCVTQAIPEAVRAFIHERRVSETPARLRALAEALDRTLVVEIGMLRRMYKCGDGSEGRRVPGVEREVARTRELQLQALLAFQLGCLCLVPGRSRLRVGREKDPLPRAILQTVGKYLGDLQLRQVFELLPLEEGSPPSAKGDVGEADLDSSFPAFMTAAFLRVYRAEFPKSVMSLLFILNYEPGPDALGGLGFESDDMQVDPVAPRRRPKAKVWRSKVCNRAGGDLKAEAERSIPEVTGGGRKEGSDPAPKRAAVTAKGRVQEGEGDAPTVLQKRPRAARFQTKINVWNKPARPRKPSHQAGSRGPAPERRQRRDAGERTKKVSPGQQATSMILGTPPPKRGSLRKDSDDLGFVMSPMAVSKPQGDAMQTPEGKTPLRRVSGSTPTT
jgi:hypothetical protein